MKTEEQKLDKWLSTWADEQQKLLEVFSLGNLWFITLQNNAYVFNDVKYQGIR